MDRIGRPRRMSPRSRVSVPERSAGLEFRDDAQTPAARRRGGPGAREPRSLVAQQSTRRAGGGCAARRTRGARALLLRLPLEPDALALVRVGRARLLAAVP